MRSNKAKNKNKKSYIYCETTKSNKKPYSYTVFLLTLHKNVILTNCAPKIRSCSSVCFLLVIFSHHFDFVRSQIFVYVRSMYQEERQACKNITEIYERMRELGYAVVSTTDEFHKEGIRLFQEERHTVPFLPRDDVVKRRKIKISGRYQQCILGDTKRCQCITSHDLQEYVRKLVTMHGTDCTSCSTEIPHRCKIKTIEDKDLLKYLIHRYNNRR